MNDITALKLTAFVAAAEWLSSIFSAPPSPQRVAQGAARQEQDALRWMGELLNAPAVVEALCATLTQDAPESLAVHLQRRYTMLFESIFRHRAVLPYESAWQDPGASSTLVARPASEMSAVLRLLDVRISADCPEPPDHLAIELAALATALHDGQSAVAIDLLSRLENWVPKFASALTQQDSGGFYAAAGELLLALIDEASVVLKRAETVAVSIIEERSGASV
ncbi:MAG TPA: molecular chaperone TorD family protein [Marinobacter sp.]|nr:molecular chaperone TorD family protein [Marinobacter sp.]